MLQLITIYIYKIDKQLKIHLSTAIIIFLGVFFNTKKICRV